MELHWGWGRPAFESIRTKLTKPRQITGFVRTYYLIAPWFVRFPIPPRAHIPQFHQKHPSPIPLQTPMHLQSFSRRLSLILPQTPIPNPSPNAHPQSYSKRPSLMLPQTLIPNPTPDAHPQSSSRRLSPILPKMPIPNPPLNAYPKSYPPDTYPQSNRGCLSSCNCVLA